jgi:DNA replication protein DnaC
MVFAGFSTDALVGLPPELFSEVIPAITLPSELKVTLQIFYRMSRQRITPRRLSWDDLAADKTLRRSLRAVSKLRPVEDMLAEGLEAAVRRATVLHLALPGDGRVISWYLVNTAANRDWAEQLAAAQGALTPADEPPAERPSLSRISAWSRRCSWTSCARLRSATHAPGSRRPCARPCAPTPARGAISARCWRGGPPMDDRMQRIGPSDLSMLKNIPTAPSATSSDEAAMRATSEEPEVVLCARCKGIGYLVADVPYGHPNFGELITCQCRAAEKNQLRRQRLLTMSNLGPFSEKTFENFDAGVPGVARAYARARKFAEHPNGWLILFGGYGCGKTHLGAAIANQVLREYLMTVLLTVVPDLLDHLRSTFGPHSEVEYDERFEEVRSAQVLILDDFGTENATPWAREKLFQLVNHRYNYRLPTVITSNRKPEDLDPRIFSRMTDRDLCDEITLIDAEDYRRKHPAQRFEQKKQGHLQRFGRREGGK